MPEARKAPPRNGLSICFFGSARYRQPLRRGQARKWAALAQLADELRVIGFADSGRPRSFRQSAHFTLLPQARFSPLRHLTLLTLGAFALLRARWQYRCRLLIAQSPYEGAVCVAVARLARLFGARTVVIVESHNDFRETLFRQREQVFARLYRAVMAHMAGYAIRRADLLRSVSAATAGQLREIGPATPQVRFIAWTDADIFRAAGKERSLPPATIVYAGALIPRKGVHHLIEAFARAGAAVADTQLRIIGAPVNADYARSLRQLAGRLHIAEQTQFLGELAQDELAAHFAEARCSVLPSTSEALGRVLLESQLAGTPVIAARVGGMVEIVRDGDTGYLIAPEDPAALAEALVKMLALSEAEWRAMSEKARAFARATFSTEAYLAGYRQLIARARKMLR